MKIPAVAENGWCGNEWERKSKTRILKGNVHKYIHTERKKVRKKERKEDFVT